MRLRVQQEIDLPSGWLLLGDATALPSRLSRSVQGFGGLRKPIYQVYGRDGLYVVDAAPRLFKAAGRRDFSRVGSVTITSDALALCDADEAVQLAARDSLEQGQALLLPVLQTSYVLWIEQRDESWGREREILAVGPRVTLLLSGEYADQIHELERAAARALRAKGVSGETQLSEARASLLNLHNQGCRDRRLRMLAGALRVELGRSRRRPE